MPEEKKIIVDEDWKAQVQAEKEAAAKKASGEAASPGPSGAKAAGGETAGAAFAAETDDPAMPPASFEMLVTTLATEALVALGQVPHPATGKAQLHRNQAQYLIDMLDVLQEKSKGNLNASEQQMLDSLLHQLRLAFVALTTRPTSSGSATEGQVER